MSTEEQEMTHYCQTDPGQVRERNEDSIAADSFDDVSVLLVADGLGLHPAGHIASKITTDTFYSQIQTHYNGELNEGPLRHSVQEANAAVRNKAEETIEYKGMASTLVAAVIQGKQALIGNVGDSRAYLLDDGIEQITQDQIERVCYGGIRSSTLILQAVGLEDKIEPDFHSMTLNESSVLLLCSDGLTSEVPDFSIHRTVSGAESLEEAGEALIQQANDRGGGDNISVCLYAL